MEEGTGTPAEPWQLARSHPDTSHIKGKIPGAGGSRTPADSATLRFSVAQPRIKAPARISVPGAIPEAPGCARGWECLRRWRRCQEKPRPDPIPKGAAAPRDPFGLAFHDPIPKGAAATQPKGSLWICIPLFHRIQVLCRVRKSLSLWKDDGAGREASLGLGCRNSHLYLGKFYPGISSPASAAG